MVSPLHVAEALPRARKILVGFFSFCMAVPIDPVAADLAALEDPAPPAAPVSAAVDPVLPAPPAPNVQPAGAVAGQHEQFNEVFLEFCAFFFSSLHALVLYRFAFSLARVFLCLPRAGSCLHSLLCQAHFWLAVCRI